MSAPFGPSSDLTTRVQQYLEERRRLGFKLCSLGHALRNFARFVTGIGHMGPLTVDLMAQWARQVQPRYLVDGQADSDTAARRLAELRPFMRWLQQYEPSTEIADDCSFGPIPGRVAPHIYREAEIVALMGAARRLGPPDGLRAATYATLFGLIASAGLRISEALGLADLDVDLDGGVLTVRQTKFGKSRLVPLHPSSIGPLAAYRALRRQHVRPTPRTTFFVGSRGVRRGEPLGDRQAHRMFAQLRQQLGWVDRGGHGQPRVHDLRHYSESRNMPSRPRRRGLAARGKASSSLGIFPPATHRGVTGDDDGTHIGDSGGRRGRGLVPGAGCALWRTDDCEWLRVGVAEVGGEACAGFRDLARPA